MKKHFLLSISIGILYSASPVHAADITLGSQMQSADRQTIGAVGYTAAGNDNITITSGVFSARVNNLGWVPLGISYANAVAGFENAGYNVVLRTPDAFNFISYSAGGTSVGYDAWARACGISATGGETKIVGNTAISSTAIGGDGVEASATSHGISNSVGRVEISGDTTVTAAATGGTSSAAAATEAWGIDNKSGAVTKIIGNAAISATSSTKSIPASNAHGISNLGGNIEITKNAVITVAAENNVGSNALAEGIGLAGSSSIVVGGDTVIDSVAVVRGAGLHADAYGVQNNGGSTTADLQGNMKINVSAYAPDGAYANATGVYNVGGIDTITGNTVIGASAVGDGTLSVYKQAYGVYTSSGGTTDLKGDTSITANAVGNYVFAYSLRSTATGHINVNQEAGNPGTVKLIGDVRASNDSDIKLTMANNDSFLRGNVVGSTVTLKIANGAVWQPVYDNRNGTFNATDKNRAYVSTVNAITSPLNLSNEGIIDLTWDNNDRQSARTLSISSLNGTGGVIKLHTDVINKTLGDAVDIATVSGTPALQACVTYDPVVNNGAGYYSAPSAYTPITGSGFSVTGVSSEYRAYSLLPTFYGTTLAGIQVGISSNAKAAVSAAKNQTMLMQISVNHLKKRLGELQDEVEGDNGIWARTYNGEVVNDKYDRVESDYAGMQIGYDHRNNVKNGRQYNGVAFSYTGADNSFARGSGTEHAYDLAFYQTWFGKSGHYYDIIGKLGTLDTNYQLRDLSNNYSAAAYRTWTQSLSAEYGYRRTLSENWYAEPQVELTYGHINSVNYTSSSGMQVQQDGIDRLIGRLGLTVGKKLTNGTKLYTTFSVLHEFQGEENIKADSIKSSQDMSGSWYELIFGVNGKIGKSSTGYLNVEKLFGANMSSNWQLNAGCRFSF